MQQAEQELQQVQDQIDKDEKLQRYEALKREMDELMAQGKYDEADVCY